MMRNDLLCPITLRLFIILLVSKIPQAVAQSATDQIPNNPSDGANINGAMNPLENLQFVLTIVAFLFGFVIVIAQLLSLRRINTLVADDVAKNCAITVVITAALVLIIAGYNSSQIAPAFGLFGTIVGYLLGRSSRGPQDSTDVEGQPIRPPGTPSDTQLTTATQPVRPPGTPSDTQPTTATTNTPERTGP
jgi:hypothetical protein